MDSSELNPNYQQESEGIPNISTDVPEPQTEEAQVRLWLDRINVARRFRDRTHQDAGVPRFIDQYNGKYNVRLANMQVPPVNDVYAYIQASIAGLYFKNPYVAVNPKKKGTILGSYILESSINYYFRELDTKDEVEKEIVDTLLTGDGWHKVGKSVKTIGTGESLKLVSEKLYSVRVSWKDMVFNIGTREIGKDCTWMAQRVVRPTYEVKEMFPGNDALVGGPHPSLTKGEVETSQFKGDLNFTTLWEIHDVKTKQIYTVAEGYYKKFLKKPAKWPSYMNEFPFINLWFNYVPDEPYHMSDIKPWEPQILEKIKLVAMILNHVKRWSRQLLVKEGAIANSQLTKLEQGVDGAMIMTKANPAECAQVLQYAPMPPEVFTLIQILDQISKEVNGQPSVDRGAPEATKSRTLGELEFIKAGAKGRTDRKVNRIEHHLETIARHLIAHMKSDFDVEQAVKITGEPPDAVLKAFGDKYDPVSHTVSFTKEDILGEYDVEVRAGTTLALDKETRTQVLSMILDKAAQLAALPSIPPFLEAIISELLRDFDIQSLEQAFAQQQQQAQMEQGKQTAIQQVDVEKTQAEADKRRAQADQIRAETATTGATTLLHAAKEGVLPEAIEIGRGMGQLPG
jgi:hypothetical protein